MTKYLTLLICLLTLTWCSLTTKSSESVTDSWSIDIWARVTEEASSWVDLMSGADLTISWSVVELAWADDAIRLFFQQKEINSNKRIIANTAEDNNIKIYSLWYYSNTCATGIWEWACVNLIFNKNTWELVFSNTSIDVLQYPEKYDSFQEDMIIWGIITWAIENNIVKFFSELWGWSLDSIEINWEFCKTFGWWWSQKTWRLNTSNNQRISKNKNTSYSTIECKINTTQNKEEEYIYFNYTWSINTKSLSWDINITEIKALLK